MSPNKTKIGFKIPSNISQAFTAEERNKYFPKKKNFLERIILKLFPKAEVKHCKSTHLEENQKIVSNFWKTKNRKDFRFKTIKHIHYLITFDDETTIKVHVNDSLPVVEIPPKKSIQDLIKKFKRKK